MMEGLLHRSKIDPSPILACHFRTLVAPGGGRSLRDLVEQFGIPSAATIVVGFADPRVSAVTGAAILTLAGLFAAFLFQLTVQLLDRAATWADTTPPPGLSTSRYAELLEELSANAAYASLISAVTAVTALLVSITDKGWQERALAALTVGLLVHLGLTLLLVTRRVLLFTRAKLNEARTGSGQAESAAPDRN